MLNSCSVLVTRPGDKHKILAKEGYLHHLKNKQICARRITLSNLACFIPLLKCFEILIYTFNRTQFYGILFLFPECTDKAEIIETKEYIS